MAQQVVAQGIDDLFIDAHAHLIGAALGNLARRGAWQIARRVGEGGDQTGVDVHLDLVAGQAGGD